MISPKTSQTFGQCRTLGPSRRSFLNIFSSHIFCLHRHLFILAIFLLAINKCLAEEGFPEPTIDARCERGVIIINVLTSEPFTGIIHTRDYRRREACRVYGWGSLNTTLQINAVASKEDANYCGVTRIRETSEEQTVTIAVRLHRDLELSQDRYYSIACSQSFQTGSRLTKSRVSLRILDEDGYDTSRRLIHGNRYKFRVEISNPDPGFGMYVRNCVAFSNVNETEVRLIDSNGCPADDNLLEPFDYTNSTSSADALIKSMFKFPENNRVVIQCEVLLCRYRCDFDVDCDDSYVKRGTVPKVRPDSNTLQLLATTTVFVVEPGEDILDYLKQDECDISRFPWLLTLITVLGILLLIMLIVNIFLCTTLTCTCTKTEVVEKDQESELEDYDPYKIDWAANNNIPIHGSTYGSRSSLAKNAHDGTDSDFRPNSRYSSQQSPKRSSTLHYPNYR
ncbi:cuticlin-4 [Brevipalpus obovatus]|uniref:cuticlin-4 n=1 Tax=Brevipalpus obovatus TaxID=246614 RepID=UPI003D9F3B2E